MEALVATLIKQAFASQDERIERLVKENEELKTEIKALKEKDKSFEELNNLFDEELTKIKGYVKTYVAKDDENFSMEEYKFGEEQG